MFAYVVMLTFRRYLRQRSFMMVVCLHLEYHIHNCFILDADLYVSRVDADMTCLMCNTVHTV